MEVADSASLLAAPANSRQSGSARDTLHSERAIAAKRPIEAEPLSLIFSESLGAPAESDAHDEFGDSPL